MSVQVVYKQVLGIPAGTGTSSNLDTSDIGGDRTITVGGNPAPVGTFQFQGSNDAGATWDSVGSAVTNTGAQLLVGAFFKLMRLNCTAYTSGQPTAQVSGNKVASTGP